MPHTGQYATSSARRVVAVSLQESRLVRQLKSSIAAETQARSLADSACTLLQQQAADLADATAQREVRL